MYLSHKYIASRISRNISRSAVINNMHTLLVQSNLESVEGWKKLKPFNYVKSLNVLVANANNAVDLDLKNAYMFMLNYMNSFIVGDSDMLNTSKKIARALTQIMQEDEKAGGICTVFPIFSLFFVPLDSLKGMNKCILTYALFVAVNLIYLRDSAKYGFKDEAILNIYLDNGTDTGVDSDVRNSLNKNSKE